MASRSYRNRFTVEEKIQMIRTCEANPNKPLKDVAFELNVPESTLSGIIKHKAALISQVENGMKRRKNAKKCRFPELEKALVQWFHQQRSAGVSISGPIFMENARRIAARFVGSQKFVASISWFQKFMKRHNIVFRTISGENASVDMDEAKNWQKEKLPKILEGYAPEDCYNADEFALNYNLMPNKSMVHKTESCHGSKLSKQRLTALLCTNATGTDKLPPLVIGKYAKPRCFKNVKKLPCIYTNQVKAWMTSVQFEKEVRKLDSRMGAKNRKILLMIDNCPAHPPNIEGLKNVKIVFFPPNSTSVLQPLDQGVIRTCKAYFRKHIIRRYICMIDNGKPKKELKINVLQALHYLALSWEQVTATTIKNCFCKAGVIPRESEPGIEEAAANVELSAEEWCRMRSVNSAEERVTFEEFLCADDNCPTTAQMSLKEIADTQLITANCEEEEEDDDDAITDTEPVTSTQGLLALETLKQFLYEQSNIDPALMDLLVKLEINVTNAVLKMPKKQTTLDLFIVKE